MKHSETEHVSPSIIVDVQVQSLLWETEPAAEETLRTAIAIATTQVPAEGEVSVVLTDDDAIRALNCQWRSVDKPTNVLSFPFASPYSRSYGMIGDIIIAYETVAREAMEEHKPMLDHLAHLVVHGYLHLMGYDHQNDSEANVMEDLERVILDRLGIVDPYEAKEVGAA
jgi:probable rRNA maturation factor